MPTGSVPFVVLPRDLSLRLERTMQRYCDASGTALVVERRRLERRSNVERRAPSSSEQTPGPPAGVERRRIRNEGGRRIGEGRATLIPVAFPAPLPRRAQPSADRLLCVERIALTKEHQEDWDTARLITRFQAGDSNVFADLYMRYFDRVYGYLRMALRDSHEAEDATQQVFLQVMEALSAYELRAVPFRAWLFRIVRNYSINTLVKHNRVSVEDPQEIDRRRDEMPPLDPVVLDWLSDKDLMVLVSRLPLAQRQVIMLRYMLDLSAPEIAEVLGRSPDAVRQLQQRAMTYLRTRLTAIGRGSMSSEARAGMSMRRASRPSPVLRARRRAIFRRPLAA